MDADKPNSDRPLVSVVVTTKNRAPLLREAIDSVFSTDRTTFDLEVIVVDDGSTDDTPSVLADFPVRVIRTDGVGMAGARNLGLHAATGDYVTLLDDDDVWLPTNIAPQLALLEAHPEYGAAHGQCQIATADLEPVGPPFPQGPLTSGPIFDDLLTYFPQVACIVTRTSVAREVGDLDGSLTGDTDWDWLLRVAARHPIGRVEQPVMLFRQRGESNEALSWRRFPAMVEIFQKHTRPLGWRRRLRLRPILWKHRGQWAFDFINNAQRQWRSGDRKRAARCVVYGFRCSPPHAAVNLLRLARTR